MMLNGEEKFALNSWSLFTTCDILFDDECFAQNIHVVPFLSSTRCGEVVCQTLRVCVLCDRNDSIIGYPSSIHVSDRCCPHTMICVSLRQICNFRQRRHNICDRVLSHGKSYKLLLRVFRCCQWHMVMAECKSCTLTLTLTCFVAVSDMWWWQSVNRAL